MPVYEYECVECGERLEARQSFTDDPLTECPVCSGRLRKVLSAVGVVFKGSGFYRNDSRKGSGESGDKKSADSGAAKESSSSSSSGSGPSTGGATGDSGSKSSSADSTSSSSTTKAAAPAS